MKGIKGVQDVVRYIEERLEYLKTEKEKLKKISDDRTNTRSEVNAAAQTYTLRVGMTNELVIIQAMLKHLETAPVRAQAPDDFVSKAFDMVGSGTLEHMQATYTSAGVVVIVRKPTAEELQR